MKKFVPFEKLSKKKQKELNKVKRSTWGIINPVTKCNQNSKTYNRKKLRSQDLKSFKSGVSFLFMVE